MAVLISVGVLYMFTAKDEPIQDNKKALLQQYQPYMVSKTIVTGGALSKNSGYPCCF